MSGRRRGGWARSLSLLLAGCVSLLAGCVSRPEPVETGLLMLWEVQAPGGAGGSATLLGSLHLGRGRFALDPAVTRAYREADVLVFEVAPAEIGPVAVAALLQQLGQLPPGSSLEDLLPPATWSALCARLAAGGVPVESVQGFEPWVALFQVMGLDLAAAGFQAENGLERQLLAQAPGRPVLGLETVRFQLGLFDQLPLATQVDMLAQTLRGGAHSESDLELMLAAWEAGDDRLLEMLVAPQGSDPAMRLFHERIFTERNRNMAQRLGELLQQPAHYFVTVGAGHTVGSSGIPALLRRQGFLVRRIPQSP